MAWKCRALHYMQLQGKKLLHATDAVNIYDCMVQQSPNSAHGYYNRPKAMKMATQRGWMAA